MGTYFDSLPQSMDAPILKSLREKAQKEDVPIIQEDGLRFLKQLLILTNPKSILEVGTAIGYSTIAMASFSDAFVTTIERDEKRAKEAKKYFEEAELTSRIRLIEGDALEVDLEDLGQVDVLFIDAAKAQNIKFFERFEGLVRVGGIIVTDNLLFHGAFNKQESQTRNVKQLLRKINDFNQYILKRKGYDTVIHPIGDGMSVSIKKGGNL